MPDKKISALTAGSALGGTEKIPMVQSSSTVYTTPADIFTYLSSTLQTRIKCAYLADVKTVNTSGGSSSSGSRATRDIAVVSDPDSIITSVTSNKFKLEVGEYFIVYRTPAFKSGALHSWLYNVTASTDAINGRSAYADTSSSVQIDSGGSKLITIAAQTEFKIQIQVGVSQASNGLGVASNMGSSEVYTEAWVYKLD